MIKNERTQFIDLMIFWHNETLLNFLFQMSQISLITIASVEFGKNLFSIYNDEIEENEKWFSRNSMTIRNFINPNWITEMNTTDIYNATTDDPSKYGSNMSPKFHNYLVLLQIFIISVSVKLFT